jgi:hypothetical protein
VWISQGPDETLAEAAWTALVPEGVDDGLLEVLRESTEADPALFQQGVPPEEIERQLDSVEQALAQEPAKATRTIRTARRRFRHQSRAWDGDAPDDGDDLGRSGLGRVTWNDPILAGDKITGRGIGQAIFCDPVHCNVEANYIYDYTGVMNGFQVREIKLRIRRGDLSQLNDKFRVTVTRWRIWDRPPNDILHPTRWYTTEGDPDFPGFDSGVVGDWTFSIFFKFREVSADRLRNLGYWTTVQYFPNGLATAVWQGESSTNGPMALCHRRDHVAYEGCKWD